MKNIPFELRQELLQLLMKISNPESVAIAPNVSDPKYKYTFREDGTIKAKERSRLSNGQLGN
jgi:hypothetical protein